MLDNQIVECSAFAETGNRRLLAELGPLFSLSLVISSAHLGSTCYEVFARKCLMRDFVTYIIVAREDS